MNGPTAMYGHIINTSKSTIIINPIGTLATLSLMYPRVESQTHFRDSDSSSTKQLGCNLHKNDIVEIVNIGVWDIHNKCICNSVLKMIPHPFEGGVHTQQEKEPQEVHSVTNSFRLRKSMKI
jgi:hypothetical protein